MNCPVIKKNSVLRGDSVELMNCLEENSVDAIVTDPPYNINLPSSWDSFKSNDAYQQWIESWASTAKRVLKPGGYLLSFASPRLQHRVAHGIENAGFEIRDTIDWIYATGFPKSRDIGKMIEKKSCIENKEKETGRKLNASEKMDAWNSCKNVIGKKMNHQEFNRGQYGMHGYVSDDYKERGRVSKDLDMVKLITDDGKRWKGWGFAIKPAHESIIMAQKPLDGTYIDNVLKWDTGALNLEGVAIPFENDDDKKNMEKEVVIFLEGKNDGKKGRVPSNIVITDPMMGSYNKYFLVPKATRKEKTMDGKIENNHPSVKPIELMKHLVALVTRNGGTVLDPFAGSGTTLVASKETCRNFIGIDIDQEHVSVTNQRIEHAMMEECNEATNSL